MARKRGAWNLRRLLWRLNNRKRVRELYESMDFLDAYAMHTDMRTEQDFRAAVGGDWEVMGRLQFDFLVRNGLRPQHEFLDIGCGTLRGGRHFIRYLEAGNYTGTDLSGKAIGAAARLVEVEGMSEKQPRLLVKKQRNLSFEEFESESFDYLLAQSVFTHLKAEHIEECFRHIGRIMRPESCFFFTYYPGPEYRQRGRKTFEFPFSFFESLAELRGFELTDRAADYPHPSRQRMAMLRHRATR